MDHIAIFKYTKIDYVSDLFLIQAQWKTVWVFNRLPLCSNVLWSLVSSCCKTSFDLILELCFLCFFFNSKEDCRIKNGEFSRTLNLPHIKWWAELSWKLNWKNLASLIYGLYFRSWKSGWRKKLGRLRFVLISSKRKVSNHSYHYEYLLDAKYSSTCIYYVL